MCDSNCDCNSKCACACDKFKSPSYNTCNIKIKTLPCNPTDTELWCNQLPLNEYGGNNEVIKSNIVNGYWQCNFEELDEDNNYLCRRKFFDGVESIPYNYVNDVNINSCLLNINKPLNRYLPRRL